MAKNNSNRLSLLAFGAGGAFVGGLIAGASGITNTFWIIVISLFFNGIGYVVALRDPNEETAFLADGGNIVSRVFWTAMGALPLFGFTGPFGLIGYWIVR